MPRDLHDRPPHAELNAPLLWPQHLKTCSTSYKVIAQLSCLFVRPNSSLDGLRLTCTRGLQLLRGVTGYLLNDLGCLLKAFRSCQKDPGLLPSDPPSGGRRPSPQPEPMEQLSAAPPGRNCRGRKALPLPRFGSCAGCERQPLRLNGRQQTEMAQCHRSPRERLGEVEATAWHFSSSLCPTLYSALRRGCSRKLSAANGPPATSIHGLCLRNPRLATTGVRLTPKMLERLL